jgi:hypothetical protein
VFPFYLIFLVSSFLLAARIARAFELALLPLAYAGGRLLCVGRNASYVYEIYYCSIAAGSQKICRNIVNTLS